jgi:hypothetical protein
VKQKFEITLELITEDDDEIPWTAEQLKTDITNLFSMIDGETITVKEIKDTTP